MDEGAGADAGEDGVAVDVGGGSGDLDGVEEGFADEGADAAEEEPGRVVARRGHNGAIGDTGEDHNADVGQEMYSGCEGRRVADELEEEWDEVDWDECCGTGAGSCAEE